MYSVAINNAQRIREEQFQAFIKECLMKRSKVIDGAIYCNKFKSFNL